MKTPQDSFSNFILLSVGFHGLLFIVLTVKVLFFPTEIPEYTRAVRVDVVALPEKQIETPKPPVPTKPEAVKKEQLKPSQPMPPKVVKKKPLIPKPKKIVKKKPEVKKVKEEQSSAIARLKALQKLKNQKKESNKKIEYKGNELSKGNSLTGLAKLHHQDYLDQLDAHIRNHWNLPEWLADGNLRASVLLLINRSGGISGKSFVMKSGNDLFDQHVFSTLDKAAPLPVPPASLINFYATKGVEIRFPE